MFIHTTSIKPSYTSQRSAANRQMDLHYRAILPHAHMTEVLVERGLEVTNRIPAPGVGMHPPAEGVHSVDTDTQLGPVLRITCLVDETIEERLSLSHGDVDFGRLNTGVPLLDDLVTDHRIIAREWTHIQLVLYTQLTRTQ